MSWSTNNAHNNNPKSVEKLVNKAIEARAEPKFHIASFAQVPTLSGDIRNITNGIVAGPDADERNGNLIRIKNVELRMSIRKNSNVLATITRVLVIRSNVIDTPVLSSILQAALDPVLSPHSREVKISKTFQILCDKTFVNTELTSTRYTTMKCGVNKDCSWVSPASSTATQSIGALYVLTLSDEPAATAPEVLVRQCVHYTDL